MTSRPTLHIAPIVEGHGEELAVPILFRRIGTEVLDVHLDVVRPWRLAKGRMTKAERLAPIVAASRARIGTDGLVVVVVDADDDDPEELRQRIIRAAGQPIECAVAVHEYEAWFLAGYPSSDRWDPRDCERISDAKGRYAALTGQRYRAALDQAGVTARLKLEAAQANSPSFQRLVETMRILAS